MKKLGLLLVLATTALFTSCEKEDTPIDATSITQSKSSIELFCGDEETLTYTIVPENATNKGVEWSTSDNTIATVDNTGKVTALEAGIARITIATINGITDVCEVTVVIRPIKVTGISFLEANKEIEETDVITLDATISPSDATNKAIIWGSDNADIASVSEDGRITGKKIGATTITATSEDGEFVAQCDIMVTLKGIVLSTNDNSNLLISNRTKLIEVKSITTNEAYIGTTWSSSNPDIATVQSDGEETNTAIVTPKQLGQTTITAYSACGLKSAEYIIDVVDITNFIKVQGKWSLTSYQNGYLVGSCSPQISNTSDQSVQVTLLMAYDGTVGSGITRYHSLINLTLHPTRTISLRNPIPISNWYKPIFAWQISWEGKYYIFYDQMFK